MFIQKEDFYGLCMDGGNGSDRLRLFATQPWRGRKRWTLMRRKELVVARTPAGSSIGMSPWRGKDVL